MSSQTNLQAAKGEMINQDGRFGFWQKWLLVMVELYIVFGVFIAFFNNTAVFDLLNQQIATVFWDTAVPEGFVAYQSWLYGLLGAILIAWGINMFFITQNAFKRQEKWGWQALFWAMLAWYLIDTILSLRFGVVFNAVLNTVLFSLGLLPLALTRKYF